MNHTFRDAVGYRSFGPRWPLQMYSTGQQRRIVHWCCPDDVKAIPNPYPRPKPPETLGKRINNDEYRELVAADPDARAFYRELSAEFADGGPLDVQGYRD